MGNIVEKNAVVELAKDLYNVNAIKFGKFTLKSRRESPYYIDLRVLSSHPRILERVGILMGRIIESLPEEKKPTRLCGIPAAGLAIANAISFTTGIPVCYTRKEPIVYKDLIARLRKFLEEEKSKLLEKDVNQDYINSFCEGYEKAINTIEELGGLKTHGIMRYVDGEIQDGDRIAIVDDLITTAESKLEAINLIKLEAKRRNISVNMVGVYVLIDREQGGKETLEKEGIKLYSLLTVREAAKYLFELGILDSQKYNTIVNYTLEERKHLGLE